MMNQIKVKNCRTKYASHEHPMFLIDGIPIDQLFSNKDRDWIGLVPSLWALDNINQMKLARQRASYDEGKTVLFPVLICPDDCDFSCTVIVAETRFYKDKVTWLRLGLDKSDNQPEYVGTTVEWQSDLGPYHFDRVNYEKAIEVFKTYEEQGN